jgi:hypothetical protein
MGQSHTRYQQALLVFADSHGDLHDLLGRLVFAVNDFGKVLAQGAMEVHLGKTKFRQRSRLEGVQDLGATDLSGAKLFQQRNGFSRCHEARMPRILEFSKGKLTSVMHCRRRNRATQLRPRAPPRKAEAVQARADAAD